MIVFDRLFRTLEKRGKTPYNLIKDRIIGGGTLQRIRDGKSISTDTVNDLCNYLSCKPSDIMTYTRDTTE